LHKRSPGKSPEKSELERLRPVSQFLDSKGRCSTNTRKDYLYALLHFNKFLKLKPHAQTAETILQSLLDGKTNVYELLDNFLKYLMQQARVAVKTVRLYLAAIMSYLGFHDIDIIPSRFKKKVTVPKLLREDEQPIDAHDIRKLLLKCNNRRLKTYLLLLASGGMRTVEALAIRVKDIGFTVRPTKIRIRAEFSKTRTAREIYISDEATNTLYDWIDWKYKNGT
jgi:integrase